MNRAVRVIVALVLLGGLSLALLGGLLFLLPPSGVVAQVPPTKGPIEPPSEEPPTEEPPTEEPPTEEPPTEEPPTDEPSTEQPATEEPPHGSDEPENDKPNPNCQATVSGSVTTSDGKMAVGATVTLEGEGVSRSMMTDDQGRYGFGGLCPGTFSLVASLPGGGTVHAATFEIDGRSAYSKDLSPQQSGGGSSGEPTVAVAVQATAEPVAQESPATEPSMPTTGFPGWLLLGGAAMGTMLLILAGARRAFDTSQVRSRD